MKEITDSYWKRFIPIVQFTERGGVPTILTLDAKTKRILKHSVEHSIHREMSGSAESFYLNAARMHLELAKEFYVLSQGESNTVLKGVDVNPVFDPIQSTDVEHTREAWAKAFDAGWLDDIG